MKMLIEIYKNNEKVNEIISTDAKEIYKKIVQIYNAKENKRTTRTTILTSWNNIHKATEIYDQTKTQMQNIKYKYIYYFEGVEL